MGMCREGLPEDLQAVAVRRHTRNSTEFVGKMALIGKSASQCDLRDLQISRRQQRLRFRNADAAQVFADRAPEVAMELAADVDWMTTDGTAESRQGDTSLIFLSDHFPNLQQPWWCTATAWSWFLGLEQQQLQRHCFDV
jgi:hypothetical protein